MKFTTGTKQINDTFFTVKRVKDENLELDYNVEIGKQIAKDVKTGLPVILYHNVPEKYIKVGENIYTPEGKFLGYRSE